MTERLVEDTSYENDDEPELARVYFTPDPEYPGEEPDFEGLEDFLHQHGIKRLDVTLRHTWRLSSRRSNSFREFRKPLKNLAIGPS